jgi:putative transport protein
MGDLFASPTSAGTIVLLSICAALGMLVGKLRVRGVGLGVAAVLLVALLATRFKPAMSHDVLHFARDLGLVLFVYSLGTQIGPGFFSALRRSGLRANVVAAVIVLLGTLLTFVFVRAGMLRLDTAVGVLAGSTTNTPSLAAGQAALTQAQVGASASTASYALVYALGIGATIAVMLFSRAVIAKIPVRHSAEPHTPAGSYPVLVHANIDVTNAQAVGVPLRKFSMIHTGGVVLTRHLSGENLSVPTGDTRLKLGDVVLAVGPEEAVDQVRMMLGEESGTNLREMPGPIEVKKLAVTRAGVVGKTLRELNLNRRLGVTVSRLERAGVEMAPSPDIALNFADVLTVVGTQERLAQVQGELGDSRRALQTPQMVPMFLGVALGVLVGSVPIAVPGLSMPIKLGLAAGPMLVGLMIGRLGRVGPLLATMPTAAATALGDLGIALFLASVGLLSGDAIWTGVQSGEAMMWVGLGAVIAGVPLVVGALLSHVWLGMKPAQVMGLLAGSMTDPPALALASEITQSDEPAVTYATVYPLTAVLRVICVQVLVIALVG